jgi:hypothetical protein
VPAAALTLIQQYLSDREDSIGADQTSTTSWLTQVTPLMTANGLASANDYGPYSTAGDYGVAHQYNWVIQVKLTYCTWATPTPSDLPSATTTTAPPLTATSGEVTCTFDDTVLNSATKAVIAPSQLPYGWLTTGPQPVATLALVNQNGQWLIDNDLTDQSS